MNTTKLNWKRAKDGLGVEAVLNERYTLARVTCQSGKRHYYVIRNRPYKFSEKLTSVNACHKYIAMLERVEATIKRCPNILEDARELVELINNSEVKS